MQHIHRCITYMNAYIHAWHTCEHHMCAHMHTHTHVGRHTYMRSIAAPTCIHHITYAYPWTMICIYTCVHMRHICSYIRRNINKHMHRRMQTYTNESMHARMHAPHTSLARIHTYMHICTHIYKLHTWKHANINALTHIIIWLHHLHTCKHECMHCNHEHIS